MKKLLIFPILFILSCSTEPVDCAGIENGSAYLDDCEQCVGGTTGNVANYLKDCAGICGGATMQEYCDECVTQSFDCAGECDGGAMFDECGICDGSGIPNGTCDCEGTLPATNFDCDGNCITYVDCEGACGGDNFSCTSFDYGNAIMRTDEQANELGVYGDGDYSLCVENAAWNATQLGMSVVSMSYGEMDVSTPSSFVLSAAYPNPFYPSTTINISIPEAGSLSLVVLDKEFNEIRELCNNHIDASDYSFTWDGKNNNQFQVEDGLYRVSAAFDTLKCYVNILLCSESNIEDCTY